MAKQKKKTQEKKDYLEFIEENIIKMDISYRGGTLKIDVSSLFPEIPQDEAIMGAYQNYLGGGMAGSVVGGAMFYPSELKGDNEKKFYELKEDIKKYFFFISNNLNLDEWAQSSYEHNQSKPVSAY